MANDYIKQHHALAMGMSVDGQMYGFKVGPFVEWPFGDYVTLQFQGGFAALLVDGKFTWNETVSTGGSGSGTPGGAPKSIQYNNAGAFAGFGRYSSGCLIL